MTLRRRLFAAALAGLLGIWATSALGFWQLRRAAEKERLQQSVEAAALAPPAVPDVRALHDPASLVHRHLALRGRWLPDDVVYLDNRPQAGQAGLYVLMPLRLEAPNGVDVIVNRGWIPRNGADRARIAPYRTPDGTVELSGVTLVEEPRLLELSKSDRSLKGIWQNFDFDAYAKVSGKAPLPLVVRQDRESTESDSAPAKTDDGLSREWPDRGGVLQSQIDRHHGYAFQWFALAVTLAALLLFQVTRAIRNGRTVPQ